MNVKEIYINAKRIKITAVKLIDTHKGTSIEGQKLTGKKLIITGYVITSFYFNCLKEGICHNGFRNFCGVDKKIPFSTFIVVPEDSYICDEMKIYLSSFILVII